MGFSVKSPSSGLEYSGGSLNSLFAQRLNLLKPSFYVMIKDILKFNRIAVSELEGINRTTTINDFLKKHKFGSQFIDNYIIPMGAAIWSTSASMTTEMPAAFYIRFFKNHGLLQIFNRPQWFVISGGSKSYIEKIVRGYKENIKLSTPVQKVRRSDKGIEVFYGDHGSAEIFDKVVFATHSDQALELLEDPSLEETNILGSLPYQKNEAVLHTDSRILPKKKITWSSWNFLNTDKSKPVSLTYNMNILQSLETEIDFLVTLNGDEQIDPKKIIKRILYHHPLFTVDGIEAQKKKHQISGVNNTFYCGAYWGNGFHEDGVNSAQEVCNSFNKAL
jgi:predicted NAD/FAD-binding protein